jgi:E3 ubiquitin-protein ligase NEDD4-like
LSKKKKRGNQLIYVLLIRLVINYRFVQRIALQMNALRQGFQEILPLESLKVFDEKEVEV